MQPVSILLLDDDPDSAKIVSHVMVTAGFTGVLRAFPDAATGLRYLQEVFASRASAPEIVLIDLGLPDRHGFDILRVIRANPIGAKLFVAVLSASTNKADIDGAFSLGANAYLERYPAADEWAVLRRAIGRRQPAAEPLCFVRSPIREWRGI